MKRVGLTSATGAADGDPDIVPSASLPEARAEGPGKRVKHHEPEVMPGARILPAGIAKAENNHKTLPAFRWSVGPVRLD